MTSYRLQLSPGCKDGFNAFITLFTTEGDGGPRITLETLFSYTRTSCFLWPQIHKVFLSSS